MNPSQNPVSVSYSIDGITKTTLYRTVNGNFSFNVPINATPTNPGAARESGMLLYQSLHGKLAKDPASVKQKLADVALPPTRSTS
jgi:CO dehydrogenase/acetyl-CoA synthase delta subunit